jgi:hydrogenase/urease accessory protein HupE
MRRWCARWVWRLLLGLGLAGTAQAHLMSANEATLNIQADAAYLVVSLPVLAFQGLPLDPSGLLSAQGLQTHSAAIERQLRQHLSLQSARGPVPFELSLLSLSLAEHAPLADQLLCFVRFAWPQQATVPEDLRLRFDLFKPPAIQTLRVEVISQDRLHGGAVEQRQHLLLTPQWPQSELWPSTLQTLQRHVLQGLLHIAQGADHWLFVALLLLRQLSRRRWILLLSVFTLAHACSYGWVLFGYIQLPHGWVETSIAATLCVSALLLLVRQRIPLALELALVLGFGLVHGLGFASAMVGHEAPVKQVWIGLISFNAGVEAGQLLMALVMWRLLHRPRVQQALPSLQSTAGSLGLLISLFWMWQRWGT